MHTDLRQPSIGQLLRARAEVQRRLLQITVRGGNPCRVEVREIGLEQLLRRTLVAYFAENISVACLDGSLDL